MNYKSHDSLQLSKQVQFTYITPVLETILPNSKFATRANTERLCLQMTIQTILRQTKKNG